MSESHDNELAIELDALQAIGRALARVNDPKTRRRILQWANERFGEMPSAPIHEERPAAAADPSLTVDGVELFGETPQPAELAPAPARAPSRDDQPLDALVRGFASDIRQLAVLWQGA